MAERLKGSEMTPRRDDSHERSMWGRAARTVAHNATDATDCALLLEMLGLDPAIGRDRPTAAGTPSPVTAAPERHHSPPSAAAHTDGSPVDAARQRLLGSVATARALTT